MAGSGPDIGGLVRVTIASGARRVDVVLPSAVPVVELVPRLAIRLGLLESDTAYAGYRLVGDDGRCIEPAAGLAAAGVEDGDILTLAAGLVDGVASVHDDPAEAMAQVVQVAVEAWDDTARRHSALVAAVVLLLAAAGSLSMQPGARAAAPMAAWASAVLLGAGIALSRSRQAGATALVLALAGCVHLAAAGELLGRGQAFSLTPAPAAGAGALLAGLVAVTGLAGCRAMLLPPMVVGAVVLASGLVAYRLGCDPAVTLTAGMVLVVLGGGWSPWLALVATATGSQAMPTVDGASDGPVDVARVSADARAAHQLLLGMSATTGLALVVAAPSAVSLGPAGVATSLLASVVAMVRTRHLSSRRAVGAGLASGFAGLVATVPCVLLLEASWRHAAAVALEATGAALLLPSALPHAWRPGRSRIVDAVESLAHVALVPALVAATGILSVVRR